MANEKNVTSLGSSEDLDALFNPKISTGESNQNLNEYSPSADKGKNKIYDSIIRFVTWWEDPNHSITEKWVCWLVDPVTQRGRFVDCPSTIGKPSPLQDMYFKLKKNESVTMQKQADVFSRRHNFACVIQVIKDENNKELEGKLLVWRFGQKIHEKIMSELKPVIGDPHNPFDLLNGKLFQLKIIKVAGFNNYDQSKFIDKVITLCIPNEQGKLVQINNKTDKKMVLEYLKTNTPDLKKYGYKEWDQEIFDYVNHVINAVTGQSNVSSNYSSVINQSKQSTPTGAKTGKAPQSNISVTDISLDELTSGTSSSLGEDFELPSLPNLDDVGLSGDLDDALANL
jgi:hypothetical protein